MSSTATDTPSEIPQENPVPGPAIEAPTADSGKTDVGSVFVSNYPPFSVWSRGATADAEAALDSPPGPDVPLGLYMHIPFCRKRCKFCYFRVYIDKNAEEIQRYLDVLATEVEAVAERAAIAARPLRFVYFGGGTPSYIAVKHLTGFLDRVKAALPWGDVLEVAFECEPGTLTESKVAAYRELGVTRLSLGVEHWNDKLLRENGRAHETQEIHRCLPWIKEQDFPQLNVDLIAGMVGDTWDSWRDAVQKTIDVDPDSVTIYQMELPYNTTYSQDILQGGESPVADWETKRAWQLHAMEELEKAGYEVSSAYTMLKTRAKEKAPRFLYRDALWHGADMVGTGVASFGHVSGVHMQNLSSWTEYLQAVESGKLPLNRAHVTTERERLTRELILQMKLGELELGYFREKFGVDPLEVFRGAFDRLESKGFLAERTSGRVRLTRQGLLQVDALLPELYEKEYRGVRYT